MTTASILRRPSPLCIEDASGEQGRFIGAPLLLGVLRRPPEQSVYELWVLRTCLQKAPRTLRARARTTHAVWDNPGREVLSLPMKWACCKASFGNTKPAPSL